MLQGRSFLKISDHTKEELEYLIDFAIHLKDLKKRRIPHRYLEGQNIGLVFEKTSTRTRSAFTVACNDLGAYPEYLGSDHIQLGHKESVEDTARVLGSMFDGLEYRGFSQEDVEDLAKFAGVPVWNGLTDYAHPTQMLADYMTIKEEFGYLQGLNLAYVGNGKNNVTNSLIMAGAILGVNVTVLCPEDLCPSPQVVDLAQKRAQATSAKIKITSDLQTSLENAQVIYTDVWVSMGEEEYFSQRLEKLQAYQVNEDLLSQIKGDYIFLHCLPAFHDTKTSKGKEIEDKFHIKEMEVTDKIFRSKEARQFVQAENRLHTIKALMAATNGNLFVR